MRTTLYLDNKKVSKKKMIELIGEHRVNRMIEAAKQGYINDPLEEQSFFLGAMGVMRVEFS